MSTIEKTFLKGDVIIKEGHFANSFYIIEQGRVEVLKHKDNHEVKIAELGAGEFFGEMGLLDSEHSMHSATIRAIENTTLAIMSHEDFQSYIGQLTPGMQNLLGKLVSRLRETSQKYVSEKDE